MCVNFASCCRESPSPSQLLCDSKRALEHSTCAGSRMSALAKIPHRRDFAASGPVSAYFRGPSSSRSPFLLLSPCSLPSVTPARARHWPRCEPRHCPFILWDGPSTALATELATASAIPSTSSSVRANNGQHPRPVAAAPNLALESPNLQPLFVDLLCETHPTSLQDDGRRAPTRHRCSTWADGSIEVDGRFPIGLAGDRLLLSLHLASSSAYPLPRQATHQESWYSRHPWHRVPFQRLPQQLGCLLET